MQQTITQVLDDRELWRTRGITISGAVPRTDGSGITVLVSERTDATERALRDRYRDMPLSTRTSGPVHPVWPDPAPTITLPAG